MKEMTLLKQWITACAAFAAQADCNETERVNLVKYFLNP